MVKVTMGSKTAVYAVIAVALGYILISAVPDQIAVVEEGSQPVRSLTEKAEGLATESDTFANEKMHLPSSPSSPSFTLLDGVYAVGLLIVNLFLALGVYFLVKRRIS